MIKLNSEQEQLFQEILSMKNKYIFISGAAGTGKSVLLQEVVNILEEKALVVSLSAVAARNIGGRTIHSVFKLNFQSENTGKLFLKDSIKFLIIDEISMVSDKIFNIMNETLKNHFKTLIPFGGLNVICFGDLYQLEPIQTETQFGKSNNEKPVFYSEIWKIFKFRELIKNMRQTENVFIQNLNLLREGNCTTIDYFNTFFTENISLTDKIEAISLTPKRYTADKHNEKIFSLISQNKKKYKFMLEEQTHKIIKKEEYNFCYPASQKDAIFHNEILLCEGTKIMFTVNDRLHNQYLNGDIGEIKNISDKEITIKLKNKTFILEKIKALFFKNPYKLGIVDMVIGYPIKYAWACTIHKMQGVTIDKLIIEDVNMFANGQLYVALSRVKNSKGILLKQKISKKNIIFNELVVEEYNRLRNLQS